MKKISLILTGVLLTVILSFAVENHLKDVTIQYDMASLTQVIIKNGQLKYITSQYRGKNPVAAGGPDDYVRSAVERSISAEKIETLITLFQTSGFLDLKNTYGTDQNNRHYPIRISIKTPEIEKSVLFRSHPDYTAPSAFQKMESALLKLAKDEVQDPRGDEQPLLRGKFPIMFNKH